MDSQSGRLALSENLGGGSELSSLPLTFAAVDGLAFAAAKGRCPAKAFAAFEIGPMLELLHLSKEGAIPALASSAVTVAPETKRFHSELQGDRQLWICPAGGKTGFIR